MSYKAIDPSRIPNIRRIPFEFYGCAVGIEPDTKEYIYSIVFMTKGCDPKYVDNENLFQVFISKEVFSNMITALDAVRKTT